MPAELQPVFLVYVTIVGAAIGSFINVLVARLPLGESPVRPRSRCPNCSTQISWYDNVPMVSWLLLRGRCRSCRTRISIEYPLVEAGTAAIWLGVAWLYGPTWHALLGAILLSLVFTIALVDSRHYLIPDPISLGGLAAVLAFSFLPGHPSPLVSLLGAAAGFGVLFGVGLLGEWIFKKPAMGGGDMKMMAMVGAFLGPSGAMLTIFLGALVGTIVFAPVSLRTDREVPFGVFLAVGAATTFLLGHALASWYTGMFLS
ncbi:MAG: prepilin peptidase [Gemmatimonadales bacterium]|nr:MAG: prepilin peptidase [Gemmatimonadales bacterium]